MEEVEGEIQPKLEIKEEFILPLVELGVAKKEDKKLIEAVITKAEEEYHLLKLDSETKPTVLTSLVSSCSALDVKNDKGDLRRIKGKIEVENSKKECSSYVTEPCSKPDPEEIIEEAVGSQGANGTEDKLVGVNMDVGEIDCIVSLESGESAMKHMEDFPLENNECNDCEETFECKDSLLEHIKNVHAKSKRIKHTCKTCRMEFRYKANCRKHEKLHEDEYHFKCRYCHISFKQILTLKNHYIYVHETEKRYKCDDCDSSFKSKNNLKSHKEVHHNTTGEMFSCDFCHMEFKRRCYLKRHIKTHTNPDKKYTCADCGLKCRSKTDIAKHVLTHIGVVEKRFFCEICGAGFAKQAHVVRHTRTHSVEKTFPCELCDRAYKDQYSLKTHHETVHLGITFTCEICGFQSDRYSLKKHIKRCEGQKKYICEICHKEYFLKKWFEQHTTKCLSKKS